MKKLLFYLSVFLVILIIGCTTQVPEAVTNESEAAEEVLEETTDESEYYFDEEEDEFEEDFLTQRIEDAMERVECPPIEEFNYPDSYYKGPLIDTHFHFPAIPDWPPEEDDIMAAGQLEGRFGGEKSLLGWNVNIGEIACNLKHEGTVNVFGLFPVYEEIPEPLIEVVHQTIHQYPGLFTPFIGASGNDGDLNGFPVTDASTLEEMLDVYPGLFKGFGEIGLYEREHGSKALPPDAPRLQEIYPLIKQHNLVTYFHPDRGQLSNFELVLAQHKEINFIVHGEEIEEDIIYLMDKYPNIYYGIELGLGEENPELSRLFVGDDKEKFLDAMDKEFNRALEDHLRKWKLMIDKHPDRFMWGTDRGDAVWNYDKEVGQKLVKLARAFIGQLDPGAQEKFAYKNADSLISEPQKPIGYVGCSITIQTVEGYWQLGGTEMWSPDQGFDDGSVMNWGGLRNRWWDAFDRNIKRHPETSIIWWQLCIPAHENPTYNDANQVINSIKTRVPDVTIYVSSLAPYAHLCEGSGATGVERGQKLAEELALKRTDVRLGPIFSTLTTEETENDLCHLEDTGKEKMGRELLEFFDNL